MFQVTTPTVFINEPLSCTHMPDLFPKTIDYDEVSCIYDEVRVGDPEMIHQLLRESEVNKASLVLDIGCGTANNTLLFALASGCPTIGIDLSRGMLNKARVKGTTIQFLQCPADSLPFCRAIFGLAFMTEVIHHLPDIPSAVSEAMRVIRQGGLFCVVTQSHSQIAQRMTSQFFPGTIAIDQGRYPTIDEIRELMQVSGTSETWCTTRKFRPDQLGQEYLDTVSRRGYSMLHKISDEEYSEGLERLRAAYEGGAELEYSAGYSFVWGRK